MKRWIPGALAALLLLPCAFAQTGYVTMTAANLSDQSGSGALLSNATATFCLTNAAGTPIGVHIGSSAGGQAAPRCSAGPVNNGALVGTWQTADPAAAGTNLVPDPAFTAALGTNWTNPSSTTTPPVHSAECDTMPSASHTTVSCTVTGLLGGETVILSTLRLGNPTVISLTDSAGQTPVVFHTVVWGGNAYDGYVLSNASAGSHTFTLTVATAVTYLGLRADVFSGTPLANPIDAFSWNNASCSGTTVSGSPVTTTLANETVFAWGQASGSTALTAGSGYTLYPQSGGGPSDSAGETIAATSPGAVTASFGQSGGSLCVVRTVALKPQLPWLIANTGSPQAGLNYLAAGSGASLTGQFAASAAITVVPGQTYTFSGWIEAGVTAGHPAWDIDTADETRTIATVLSSAGANGPFYVQFTVPTGVTAIKILAALNAATIGSGQQVIFAEPLLQAGSAQLVDTNLSNPQNPCEALTITDNVSGSVLLGGPGSGYTCLQPQWTESAPMSCVAGVCNLDSYIPTTTPGVMQVAGVAGPVGPMGPAGPAGPAGASGLVWVKPENYGAKGDLKRVFDAFTVMPGTSNYSSAVASPLAVTASSNDVVVTWFDYYGTWGTTPSAGTSRINVAADSSHYGGLVFDQTIASPQTVAAVTGSITAQNDWTSGRVVLQPTSGQTVTYVNSTTVQNSSSGTVTLSVPSGVANGDFLLACVSNGSGGGYIIPAAPSGWGTRQYTTASMGGTQENPDTGFETFCWTRTASSEPSGYSWTGAGTLNIGFMIAYRNVAGIDGNTTANRLQSPTANFSAANVGNLVCLQKSTAGSNGLSQTCGTITAYNPTSSGLGSVALSFTPGTLVSGVEAVYASDDYPDFHTMLSTAPCAIPGSGCHVYLSSRYGLSSGLALAGGNLAFAMSGDGAGMPWSANDLISGIPPQNSGTQLVFLTTSLSSTTPGLLVSGGSTLNSSLANVELDRFSLIGGAGYYGDGAGGDGLDTLNWQGVKMEGVQIANFAGNGWLLDGVSGPPYSYTENTVFDFGIITLNHGAAIKTGSIAPNIETIAVTNSTIEGNGGPAFNIATPAAVQGLRIESNTIQWNNRNAAAAEITLAATGQITGCDIRGNYFEPDNVFGGKSNAVLTNVAAAIGCEWGNNKNFFNAGIPPYLTFSAAGTPLPACSASSAALNASTAYVTDATACTSGTTYTSGGSTACKVLCKGGNWVETGYGYPY